MILAKTLRGLGYDVREAANGVEALEIIAIEKTAWTLVLSDWNMPEMNGLELLKHLRQDPELASLVVIMVTTETNSAKLEAVRRLGVAAVCDKSFPAEIVRAIVDDLSVTIR